MNIAKCWVEPVLDMHLQQPGCMNTGDISLFSAATSPPCMKHPKTDYPSKVAHRGSNKPENGLVNKLRLKNRPLVQKP